MLYFLDEEALRAFMARAENIIFSGFRERGRENIEKMVRKKRGVRYLAYGGKLELDSFDWYHFIMFFDLETVYLRKDRPRTVEEYEAEERARRRD